jgi:hypothetical protein
VHLSPGSKRHHYTFLTSHFKVTKPASTASYSGIAVSPSFQTNIDYNKDIDPVYIDSYQKDCASPDYLRWPLLFGQFGGPIKLTPDHHYAANGRDNTIAGACPGDGVVAVCTYTSSGVRPAKTECGRRAL